MYWASYRLNSAKSEREDKQDQFKRLNDENEKLTDDLNESRELVERKNDEIYKLRKQLARLEANYPSHNNNKKEDKNDD